MKKKIEEDGLCVILKRREGVIEARDNTSGFKYSILKEQRVRLNNEVTGALIFIKLKIINNLWPGENVILLKINNRDGTSKIDRAMR